jgi:hypothetical protein
MSTSWPLQFKHADYAEIDEPRFSSPALRKHARARKRKIIVDHNGVETFVTLTNSFQRSKLAAEDAHLLASMCAK